MRLQSKQMKKKINKFFAVFLVGIFPLVLSSCYWEDVFNSIIGEDDPEIVKEVVHDHDEIVDGNERITEDIYQWQDIMQQKVLTCYDMEDFTDYDKANPAALLIICLAAWQMGYEDVTITSDWRECKGSNRSKHCGAGAVDFYFGEYVGSGRDNDIKYMQDFANFHYFLQVTGALDISGLGFYEEKRIIHFDLWGDARSWCQEGRNDPYIGLKECFELDAPPPLDIG